MIQHFQDIMGHGGLVMWPLLILSVLSVAFAFERAWYWFQQNGPAGRRNFVALMDALRRGDRPGARALADTSNTVYARVARSLLTDGADDAVAVGAVEHERIAMDRFMATLSTIITAAPMLGILGTVIGIITSFEVLKGGDALVDPKAVSGGISEALVATASGLVVALLSLFPYMMYGAQREKTIGRLETLISVAQLGLTRPHPARRSTDQPDGATDYGGSPASKQPSSSAAY